MLAVFASIPALAEDTWEHPLIKAWKNQPIEKVEMAAGQNNASAQYYLAWINWYGERGQTNYDAAVHWFQAAATNGVPEALFKLGVLAERGIGQMGDRTVAYDYYDKAKQAGNPVLTFKSAYFRGIFPPSRTEIKLGLSEAAKSGYPRAIYHQALNELIDRAEPDWKTFFPICQMAASHGISDAQLKLATILLRGDVVKEDRVQACKWLMLAMDGGSDGAARYLRELGHQFKADELRSARKAAKEFIPSPMKGDISHWEKLLYQYPDTNLQYRRELGRRCEKGEASAIFEKAMLLSHEDCVPFEPPANVPIAIHGVRIGYPGPPITLRDTEATDYFKKAAKLGRADAAFCFGSRLLYGVGGSVNLDEGYLYLEKSSALGGRQARAHLAEYHSALNNPYARLAEAMYLHRTLAAEGDVRSVVWLKDYTKSNFAAMKWESPSPIEDSTKLAKKIRLAILANSEELNPAVDLLTAALTDRVELLERTEIARILKEQSFSANQLEGRFKLGQVSAVDGLLYLDLRKKQKGELLSAQLLAVHPGVILHDFTTPWPTKDLEHWVRLVSGRQVSLLPKLMVSKKDAIALSLLGFSSPMVTPETLALDREVGELLISRLVAQPEIFVLERKKMGLLSDEKDLATESQNFWNGSWMLEGEINPKVSRKGNVVILAKLKSPTKELKEIEVSGSDEMFGSLVSELAVKISSLLHTNSNRVEWSMWEEAARYYDEARWQSKSGLLLEAKASADTAWALGLRLPDLSALRMQATAGAETLPVKKETNDDESKWFSGMVVPDGNQLRFAIRELEEYGRLMKSEGYPDKLKFVTGLELLRRNFELLKTISITQSRIPQLSDYFPVLREKVRSFVGVISAYAQKMDPKNQMEMDNVLLLYSGISEESFPECVAAYEKLLRNGKYTSNLSSPNFRDYLTRIAWDGLDSARQQAMWESSLERWGEDPDKKMQMSSLLALIYTSDNANKANWARDKLVRVLSESLGKSIEQGVAEKIWFSARFATVGGEFSQQKIDLVANIRRIAGYLEFEGKYFPHRKAASVREINSILITLLGLTSTEIQNQLSQEDQKIILTLAQHFGVREVEALMPSLIKYRERNEPGAVLCQELYDQCCLILKKSGRDFSSYQGKKAEASKAAGSRVIAPVPEQGPATYARPVNPDRVITTYNGEVRLNLPKLVPLDFSLALEAGQAPIEILDWRVEDKSLIVEFRKSYFPTNYYPGAPISVAGYAEGLIKVDIDTEQVAEVVGVRTNSVSLPRKYFEQKAWTTAKRFAATSAGFFWLDDEVLIFRKNGSNKWIKYPGQMPNGVKLDALNDRLFVLAPEVLLELDINKETSRVLASTRRRPAESPLDEHGDLSQLLLLPDKGADLKAVYKGMFYKFDSHTEKWSVIARFSDVENARFERSGDILLVVRENFPSGNDAWGRCLLPGQNTLEDLLMGPSKKTGKWQVPGDVMTKYYGSFSLAASMRHGKSSFWVGAADMGSNAERGEMLVLKFIEGKTSPALTQLIVHDEDFKKLGGFGLGRELEIYPFAEKVMLFFPMNGYCSFIPRTLLEANTGNIKEVKRVESLDRREFLFKRMEYWKKLYDRNKNGLLEPDESEAMRNNRLYMKDKQELDGIR